MCGNYNTYDGEVVVVIIENIPFGQVRNDNRGSRSNLLHR